jgi:hypothetical protein
MTNKPFLALITPIGSTSEPPSGGPTASPVGSDQLPRSGPSRPAAGSAAASVGADQLSGPGSSGESALSTRSGPAGEFGVSPIRINSLPGQQGPGRPTHPIYYPPVIWDPSLPSNPDRQSRRSE